ncbi:hypothetical protein C4D60_Mb08t06230 [Musa balbisiana]|uniref:Zinc/iron permease n=1 Tax=Musa balbisiana TaxID=52838 RepID=A0A4S8K1U2_MUSBA|nr:hypothetical protein C4D60_Mb08t06230 [Musa balbisiana]
MSSSSSPFPSTIAFLFPPTSIASLFIRNATKALRLKFVAIASILTAGAVGVLIPILGRTISVLQPEHDMFFVIKAFAAGVILATGLIHILPAAFQSLTSPCLAEHPWHTFPVTGFVVMSSAMWTMMIDSFATSYYKRSHFSKARPVEEDEEHGQEGHVHVHTHPPSHGHAHGSTAAAAEEASVSERIRHQVISQVSIESSRGIIWCWSWESWSIRSSLGSLWVLHRGPPPLGLCSTALIVEGVFNAASAGILVYMALVDLLAADFTNPRMQSNGRLQLGAHLALLLGAGLMSLIAIWA